jgi:hypothetical protein
MIKAMPGGTPVNNTEPELPGILLKQTELLYVVVNIYEAYISPLK